MNLERITMSNTAAVVTPCQPKIVENKMTLIEKLKIHRSRYYQEVAIAEDVIGECIEIAEEHSDWVSVDERFPSDNTVVLVYKQEFGLIGTAKYSGNGFWGFDMRTRDPMHNFTFMGGVTHWQPLPKIPNQGE